MATVNLRAGFQAELPVVGSVDAIYKVSLSASWSSGDVHIIGKIPVGAIPVEAVWYPGAAFAATGIAKFGTSASQELFFASDSYAESGITVYRNTKALGTAALISISDEHVVRYDNVVGVFTAGVSIGHVGDLVVRYRVAGQTL
jgi:hypothetical protein